MKRRRSKPLLRASVAAIGATMLACGGSSGADEPVDPPEAEPTPPVELADSRELNIVVVLPEGFKGAKRNPMLYMLTVSGERKSLGSLIPDRGSLIYTSRKQVDHRVELPKIVTVGVEIAVDDDEATPSRGDLVGEVTGVVGEELRIEVERYMPIVQAVVHAHSMKPVVDGLDRVKRPIYANTKGSQHYQTPAPVQMVQIDLEGPNEPALRKLTLRFLTGIPEADELRVEVTVPRFPAEIHVEAPPGQWVPETFQIIIDAGAGTEAHRSAQMDSMKGDTLRAVLRKP